MSVAQLKQFAIVMESAEQGSLDRWIGRIEQARLLVKTALGIVDDLEYVHAQMIHRDIKPKKHPHVRHGRAQHGSEDRRLRRLEADPDGGRDAHSGLLSTVAAPEIVF